MFTFFLLGEKSVCVCFLSSIPFLWGQFQYLNMHLFVVHSQQRSDICRLKNLMEILNLCLAMQLQKKTV